MGSVHHEDLLRPLAAQSIKYEFMRLATMNRLTRLHSSMPCRIWRLAVAATWKMPAAICTGNWHHLYNRTPSLTGTGYPFRARREGFALESRRAVPRTHLDGHPHIVIGLVGLQLATHKQVRTLVTGSLSFQ